jgi:hypothetical protein
MKTYLSVTEMRLTASHISLLSPSGEIEVMPFNGLYCNNGTVVIRLFPMSEILTIRVSEKLADALEAEARQSGLAKSEIARQALEERLRRNRRLTVMGRFFGVVDGPPDLATNKSYRRKWNKKRA